MILTGSIPGFAWSIPRATSNGIADHAAKIAESVIYLKQGEILRHRPADVVTNASLVSSPPAASDQT